MSVVTFAQETLLKVGVPAAISSIPTMINTTLADPSKFGQEVLNQAGMVVLHRTIEEVKGSINLGGQQAASNSAKLQSSTNSILGQETSLQASISGVMQGMTKSSNQALAMLMEAKMMQDALKVPTAATIKSLQRDITDKYYTDVKNLSKKFTDYIATRDDSYEKILKAYYDNLKAQTITFQGLESAVATKNKQIIKEYYDNIKKVTLPHKDILSRGNDIILKSQAYYVIVRSLSLAFYGYAYMTGSKNFSGSDSKTATYYKQLGSFESMSRIAGHEMTTKVGKKDVFDTAGEKTNLIKTEAISQDVTTFPSHKTLVMSLWTADPDYVRLKDTTGKYVQLVEYIQKNIVKYIDGTQIIDADAVESLPQSLSKISKDGAEAWSHYHSYDTMSPEMRAAIIKANSLTVDKSDEAAIRDAISPKLNVPLQSHNRSITKNYLNEVEYTAKAEGLPSDPLNIQQSVLKKGITVIDENGQSKQSLITTPETPYSSYMTQMLKEAKLKDIGTYKFFIEKLHGKKADGSGFYKRNPITKGKTLADMENRMVFAAYIEAFSDSYDVSWGEHEFVGRAEKFGVYKSTGRQLTLSFYMLSDFSAELLTARLQNTQASDATISAYGSSPAEITKSLQEYFIDWGNGTYDLTKMVDNGSGMSQFGWVPGQYSGTTEQMWARMTFLAQSCYPWFRQDGKMKEQPIIRVRIADFLDLTVRIKSLNFTEYDEFNMDLTGLSSKMGAYPMGVKCAMNCEIIHSEEPHSNYAKFYWRKDFDIAELEPAKAPQEQQAAAAPAKTPAKAKGGIPPYKTPDMTTYKDKIDKTRTVINTKAGININGKLIPPKLQGV